MEGQKNKMCPPNIVSPESTHGNHCEYIAIAGEPRQPSTEQMGMASLGLCPVALCPLYFRKPKEPRKLILPIHFLELGRPQHCHLMTNRKLTRFFLCSLFFLLTAQNQAQTLHLNNQLYSSQPHFPHSGVTHDQWLKWKLDIFLRLPELRSRGTSMEPGFKEKQDQSREQQEGKVCPFPLHTSSPGPPLPSCAHPRALTLLGPLRAYDRFLIIFEVFEQSK